MKKALFLLILLPLCGFKPGGAWAKYPHLKPYYHHVISIDEPSDICTSMADPTHFIIAGNRGSICEIDENGKTIRATQNNGSDYEACCTANGQLYVVDESARRVDFVDEATFKVKKSIFLHYGGPRNKGFEGITYIPTRKKFIIVTEKPCTIFELNEDMTVTAEVRGRQFKELSAVTYHDNFVYFLTDEGHTVMKCDPTDYSIIDRWHIPVNNPEGICFDKDGNLLIVSDDMAELFKFKM